MKELKVLFTSLILLVPIITITGCLDNNSDEDDVIYVNGEDQEPEDWIKPVDHSLIIHNSIIKLEIPYPELNLSECLELTEDKIHPFRNHTYSDVKGEIVPWTRPSQEKYPFRYLINCTMDNRVDEYIFSFKYDLTHKYLILIDEEIERNGIPEIVLSRVRSIIHENETARMFFDEYPISEEKYRWYSEMDDNPIYRRFSEAYPEFINSTLESNLILVNYRLQVSMIPEDIRSLICYFDLEKNINSIIFIDHM
jgi:hypothetical protein